MLFFHPDVGPLTLKIEYRVRMLTRRPASNNIYCTGNWPPFHSTRIPDSIRFAASFDRMAPVDDW